MHKALFLDRDGTVIHHIPYLMNPEEVQLLPHCASSLTSAQDADYKLVVISNQSGVARGMGTVEQVEACNEQLEALLVAEGVKLDMILYCPHGPESECACRKPKLGMLIEAAKQLNIDLAQSIMIGDNTCDIEAGELAGCRLNLYLNTREPRQGDLCFDSLMEAIDYALSY